MTVTDRVKKYLHLAASEIVEDEECQVGRDAIWLEMTQEERDFVNEIVELVLGEYL